jgi:transcriptional regulator GlxA family with amidase domain
MLAGGTQMPTNSSSKINLEIGFILTNKFTLSAYANFVDILNLALQNFGLCKWDILSNDREPITSSCGLGVSPDTLFSTPFKYDYIAIVGGAYDKQENLGNCGLEFLHQARKAKIPLIGLCSGELLLRKNGFMNEGDDQSSVHSFEEKQFIPYGDYIVYGDNIVCSSAVNASRVAAFLVEKHIGVTQSQNCLQALNIGEIADIDLILPGIPVELETSDELIKKALSTMQKYFQNPLSVEDLALTLGVKRRKLERHFEKHLKISPGEAEKRLRLNHAKKMLCVTDSSISQIAKDVGFCNASHFIKMFKAKCGITPSTFRLSNLQNTTPQ